MLCFHDPLWRWVILFVGALITQQLFILELVSKHYECLNFLEQFLFFLLSKLSLPNIQQLHLSFYPHSIVYQIIHLNCISAKEVKHKILKYEKYLTNWTWNASTRASKWQDTHQEITNIQNCSWTLNRSFKSWNIKW